MADPAKNTRPSPTHTPTIIQLMRHIHQLPARNLPPAQGQPLPELATVQFRMPA